MKKLNITKEKKLNITKEVFNKSKYFQNKYGKLEYVSESGKIFKDKSHPCWADTAWILDVTGELQKDN